MSDLHSVLHKLVDGLRAVGGLSEADATRAHDVISDDAGPVDTAPTFSDIEQAQLDELQARQAAAQAAAAPAAPPAVPPFGSEDTPGA